jgi:hypothetical protein
MALCRSPCRGLRVERLEDRVLLSSGSPVPVSPTFWSDLRTAWLNHLPTLQVARLIDTALTAAGDTLAERLSLREREALWEDHIEHERRDGPALLSLLPQAAPAGKEPLLPHHPQVPAAKAADGAGPLTGPALPPGTGAGVALPVRLVSVLHPAGPATDAPEERAAIGPDAVASGPQPAADLELDRGAREGDFTAEPGPPLVGLLPFDLKPLREGVDALFERLGALARSGERDSLLVALGPWLLVAGVMAWELTLLPGLLREDRADALPGALPPLEDEA